MTIEVETIIPPLVRGSRQKRSDPQGGSEQGVNPTPVAHTAQPIRIVGKSFNPAREEIQAAIRNPNKGMIPTTRLRLNSSLVSSFL